MLESNLFSISPSWDKMVASANPTFALKPIGGKGTFRRMEGEVHIGDFGATLCDLLKVCKADGGVSALTKPVGRLRAFNNYRWKHEFWAADLIPGLSTYTVRGPIGDPDSWTKESPIQTGSTVTFTDKGTSTQ